MAIGLSRHRLVFVLVGAAASTSGGCRGGDPSRVDGPQIVAGHMVVSDAGAAPSGDADAVPPNAAPCVPPDELSPLAQRASAGEVEEVRKLLAAGTDPNQRNGCGATALMEAVGTSRDEPTRKRKLQLVDLLIRAGADVTLADGYGGTALHRAAAADDAESNVLVAVRRLLAAGAPVDARTRRGVTPLLTAVKRGRAKVARTLVQAGASPTAASADGQTPLSLAEKSGDKAMLRALREAPVGKGDEPRAGAVGLASAPPQTVELALPFEGIWGVLQGTDSNETHHGYAAYALDFVPAEATASAVPEVRRKKLTDWPCFGRSVLAPAAGKVVWARDRSPDPPLNRPIKGDTGNFVIIEHAPQEFTEFRHLQAKSLRVKVGDRVTKGQEIARCGNSGNAGVPHLHVGFLGSVDPIATRPVTFSRYEVFNRGTWERGPGVPAAGQLIRPVPDGRGPRPGQPPDTTGNNSPATTKPR